MKPLSESERQIPVTIKPCPNKVDAVEAIIRKLKKKEAKKK